MVLILNFCAVARLAATLVEIDGVGGASPLPGSYGNGLYDMAFSTLQALAVPNGRIFAAGAAVRSRGESGQTPWRLMRAGKSGWAFFT
jgi:hypothetical protein